jgi:hypothetical protein
MSTFFRPAAPAQGAPVSTRNRVLKCSRAAIAVACLIAVLEGAVLAQTNDDRGGFSVRELGLSTGYAFVQLPPLTLGGKLPDDVLNADLITSGTVDVDWRHITSRTRYALELFGTYTARTRYAPLSAPGANLAFGASRAFGSKWRLGAGVVNTITSSDLLTYEPSPMRRLEESQQSFNDLADTIAFARSPNPDPTQAALFVPISQQLAVSDLYGYRMLAASARANATYAHSVRLTTYTRGNYTIVRQLSSNHDSRGMLPSPDSNTESVSGGVRYDLSERTQLTGGLEWSQTSGVSADRVLSATVGYAWSGRKWFASAAGGVAMRPFAISNATPQLTTSPSQTVLPIYDAAIGYKFRTQTLIVEYSRVAHDEYGHGGRNGATGFENSVHSVAGLWSWSPRRSHWMARSDISMIRRPGNFSYINAWLATVGIGRRLGPNVRLFGEFVVDRHGSRSFEGFDLTREGARLVLSWTPRRRSVE